MNGRAQTPTTPGKTSSAKKSPGRPKKAPGIVRHLKMELPDADYQRLIAAAGRLHLSLAGYVRLSTMERIQNDEARLVRSDRSA